MCSSIGRRLLTRRSRINIHMFSLGDCLRDKLLKSSSSCSIGTLSASSRNSCTNLILILAIVTAAATGLLSSFTQPDRPLPNGCVMSPLLRLRSSCKHTCKSRQCLFIKPHGLQLLVRTRFADNLPSSVSCIIAVRRRCVRAMFLAVSTHQERRDVGYLSARSNVALAIRNTGVVNGLRQAST